jgi:putative ATPase
MSDLFSDSAEKKLEQLAPLAYRLRPRTLEEFVGQEQILAPDSALRRAIAEDRVASMILFGPPGTGKTTLARIVAETTGAAFEEQSAVSATVSDVREVIARARERLGARNQRTILFLDEIHRFNRAQQDALLPAVEARLITLIGATTENPYFQVNSALLSRCQLYSLEPLSQDELEVIVRRGSAELGLELSDRLVSSIASQAGGDARNALNILELAAQTAAAEGKPIDQHHVEDASRKRPLVYDRAGDAHYDFASAFIKSMRGSDPDAAVYYLAAMIEAGEDPRFVARRMVIFASEDVGLADPRALQVAVAAADAVEYVGLPEVQLNLTEAAVYLSLAPKSNAVKTAIFAAREDVREHGNVRPPRMIRGSGSRLASKRAGSESASDEYIYPHDDPHGFEVDYLPEELRGRKYWKPKGIGKKPESEGE